MGPRKLGGILLTRISFKIPSNQNFGFYCYSFIYFPWLSNRDPSAAIHVWWRSMSTAKVSLAEVFHPWVRWEGPGSGFENSSGAGAAGGGGVWKSKWVGPSWAQVGGPKPGPSGWAQAGPKPEFWDPKKSKNKNYQNQNPFCPKCRQGLD